jgi:hypothetical protein
MRMMMTMAIPVEAGNRAINNGTLQKLVQSLMEDLKPEAAYFTTLDGLRTAIFFLDLKDVSDLPSVAEPAFLALNAKIDITPVMNAQDLMKGGPAMEKAMKKYGGA